MSPLPRASRNNPLADRARGLFLSAQRVPSESSNVSTIKNLSALALASLAALGAVSVHAAPMGSGLQQLVREHEAGDARLARHLKIHVANAAGEPMVHVHLQKGIDTARVHAALKAAGFKLTAISKVDASHLEGYLSLKQARALAAVPGVRTIAAVQRPMQFAGAVQSQAVALQKADLVQAAGVDGTGIKVAALSDSFDACAACSTHAAGDVATGDLPVVTVQADAASGHDEGRAMLQLIHDVAPGAQLAFATAFNGEVDFANQILALRSNFGADVIVDDVYYFDEPMFSDGILAQAVNMVAADGAAYFSSAGNNGLQGWEGTYKAVPYAEAKAAFKRGAGNIQLDQIPAALRPKSIHMFSGTTAVGTGTSLVQRISTAGENRISFQWDEPFYMGKVGTDYNIYVFDKDGNWMDPNSASFPGFYTLDDNTQTDAAYEFVDLIPFSTDVSGGANVTDYQVVIGKMNNGPAKHLKYIVENGLAVSLFENAPTTGGHSAATGGQGVAATFYAIPKFPEDFSAPGPVTIMFDANGNRLPQPEVRNSPQITAADGVDTTFFGSDADGNGWPNFFGTSAAAPDAAAVAALVLQAAGGSGSMAPAAVYKVMQDTATPMPLPNDRSHANATAGTVQFNARGDWTRWEDYYGLANMDASHSVASVKFDPAGTGLVFSTTLARFHVGDSNGVDPANITVTPGAGGADYTLTFAPGSFAPGASFRFGTSMFNPLQGSTQEDPDRMRGMKITVTMDDGTVYTGTVTAPKPEAINRFTGHGLVNAARAVNHVSR